MKLLHFAREGGWYERGLNFYREPGWFAFLWMGKKREVRFRVRWWLKAHWAPRVFFGVRQRTHHEEGPFDIFPPSPPSSRVSPYPQWRFKGK